jgi:outer membrane protein OmpU
MKKIIAAAVASAFIAPAFAADVTVSGSQEWNYQDNNGTTTSEIDGTVKIGASTETAGGLGVSAVIALDDAGAADGGGSLSISGDFGKITLGDTSGAIDAVDDINDWGYEATTGVGGDDAAMLWALPSIAPNLSIYFSAGTDSTEGAGQDSTNHTGVSFRYAAGPATVSFGTQETDGGAEERVASIKVSMQGLTAGYELHTATTAANVDTDTTSVGATYSMGDVTFAIENNTTESAGSTSADLTAVGVHYSLGGGVTLFAEQKDDSKDATAETTYLGASFNF